MQYRLVAPTFIYLRTVLVMVHREGNRHLLTPLESPHSVPQFSLKKLWGLHYLCPLSFYLPYISLIGEAILGMHDLVYLHTTLLALP